jgi:hypothetical protein
VDTLCIKRTIGVGGYLGKPSALAECRKVNSGWRIPPRRAVAGAKLHRDVLVAIRNPQCVPAIEFALTGVDGAASARALRFRDLLVGPTDWGAAELAGL